MRSRLASPRLDACALELIHARAVALWLLPGDCKVGKSSLTSAFHKGKQYNKNYVMVGSSTRTTAHLAPVIHRALQSANLLCLAHSVFCVCVSASIAAGQTLGVDFLVKTVKIPESDNAQVELYLFDTSGHAIYKELRPTYVRAHWRSSTSKRSRQRTRKRATRSRAAMSPDCALRCVLRCCCSGPARR